MAGNGPATALEFVIEVGKAANYATEEWLAPAAAAFSGVALLAEHEIVLADSLRGIFGAHLLGGKRHEVEQVYGVAVKGIYDADGVVVFVAVKNFVQLARIAYGITHPKIVQNFVRRDFAAGRNQSLNEVERDFWTVRFVNQDLF